MDRNKLEKLKEYGYEIKPCCMFCEYGFFPSFTDFGDCVKKLYEHKKHTEAKRYLSINKFGICKGGFKLGIGKTSVELGSYYQFLNENEY